MEKATLCTDPHDADTLSVLVAEYLLSQRTAGEMADIFSALADATRVRIIGLLTNTEMCVGDLCLALEMTQPAISHHLRILRNLKIVAARKAGRHVFYTLADEHIEDIFAQGLAHAEHE